MLQQVSYCRPDMVSEIAHFVPNSDLGIAGFSIGL